jgi:hypothetical protein
MRCEEDLRKGRLRGAGELQPKYSGYYLPSLLILRFFIFLF